MKKSYVFLTPATNDKAGVALGIEYDEAPQMYAEPVPYWTNDAERTKVVDSPPPQQSLAEQVKAVADAVAATCKKIKLPCNASPRCKPGKGNYKCARCRSQASTA